MQIKILRGCGASGKSLEAGRIYSVPDEVSGRDAEILTRLGKAEAYEKPAEAERKKTKADGVLGKPG